MKSGSINFFKIIIVIKIIKIIFISIWVAYLLFFTIGAFFTLLHFDSGRYTRSVQLNGAAERVGIEIDYSMELGDFTFPKDETVTLTGKYYEDKNWNMNILILANEYFNEDNVIGDYEENENNKYWAVKIEHGEVSEAWISSIDLSESDLRPYTQEDQYEHMYLVVPILSPIRFNEHGYIDSSEAYGYHCFNKKGKT